MKILLVDDEPLMCRLLKLFFDREGHETDLAYCGKEALAKLESQRFDLVIVDYLMPQMNGDTLAKLIKEQRPEPPPVVMISGYRSCPAPEGVSRVLRKPLGLDALRGVIREFQSQGEECAAAWPA